MDWSADKTAAGAPMAVLKDGDKVVCKVYLSPDSATLRVVLPELKDDDGTAAAPGAVVRGQVKVDFAHGIIDFRRAK